MNNPVNMIRCSIFIVDFGVCLLETLRGMAESSILWGCSCPRSTISIENFHRLSRCTTVLIITCWVAELNASSCYVRLSYNTAWRAQISLPCSWSLQLCNLGLGMWTKLDKGSSLNRDRLNEISRTRRTFNIQNDLVA